MTTHRQSGPAGGQTATDVGTVVVLDPSDPALDAQTPEVGGVGDDTGNGGGGTGNTASFRPTLTADVTPIAQLRIASGVAAEKSSRRPVAVYTPTSFPASRMNDLTSRLCAGSLSMRAWSCMSSSPAGRPPCCWSSGTPSVNAIGAFDDFYFFLRHK